jgi:hypothetical protein
VAMATATLFGGELIRAPASGFQIAMTIDGASAGTVRSWEGGEPRGTVVTASLSEGKPTKHIGSITYDPLVIHVALPPSGALARILDEFVTNRSTWRSITLVERDYAGAITRLAQLNAVLSEVHFPAVDGNSTEALQGKFVFEVKESVPAKDPGVSLQASATTLAANSFSFALSGVVSKGVLRIEPFSIVQRWITDPGGSPDKTPEPLELSNLLVTLTGTTTTAWQTWFDDFVIRGNNGQDAEKTAVLSFMGSDFSLKFSQVGITRITRLPATGAVLSHLSELYFEGLSFGGAATSSQMMASTALSPAVVATVQEPGGTIATPTETTAPVGDAPLAVEAGVPVRQIQPLTTVATTTQTNPADIGTRDPAEFPRVPDLKRTYYNGSFFDNYTSEQAYYMSPQRIYDLVSRITAAAKAAGWTLRGHSEDSSGSRKSVSMSWARAKATASLNFSEQEAGGTQLQLSVSVQLK